ncbi:MAG: hypothetical protein ABI128_13945 [Rhodanobacter sp.]
MSSTLRQSPGLRRCRVLAWLAWLVLVISPLQAAPLNSPAIAVGHDHAASSVHGQGHATLMVADDCCPSPHVPGQPARDLCHCASVCASTLPAVSITRLDRVAAAVPMVALLSVPAPRGVHTPLLRPPAA